MHTRVPSRNEHIERNPAQPYDYVGIVSSNHDSRPRHGNHRPSHDQGAVMLELRGKSWKSWSRAWAGSGASVVW